jgi:metallophosphoesterase (TIGR00282 family)
MKLLFVGDVIGKPGRRALQNQIPRLVDRHRIDYVVVNVENSAGGFGVTPDILREIAELPIDVYTTGNHVWDKKEGVELLDRHPKLLRPANYPAGNPGRGLHLGETAAGIPVAVINLEGLVYMSNLDSPFHKADELLRSLDPKYKVILVDFHAEVTSEKQAMGFYLDGRVSVVLGTHTHVPTADGRVLPGGTAFICDVGMTGSRTSVLGVKPKDALAALITQMPARFETAEEDVWVMGAAVEINAEGLADSIDQVMVPAHPE